MIVTQGTGGDDLWRAIGEKRGAEGGGGGAGRGGCARRRSRTASGSGRGGAVGGGGERRGNDVDVVGGVQEEVSGLGSYHLVSHLKTDYAVLGEPSGNMLALGHRGRVEVQVTVRGRSVHASVPNSGLNPL